MLGSVIAHMRGTRGEPGRGQTVALRPSMSYHHQVEGPLHGNVITVLRRDGYPITWIMFEDAYNASGDAVGREVD
eukprot:767529-Alexandrium_andersonii.AAC.1